MNPATQKLAEQVEARFANLLQRVPSKVDELCYEAPADKLLDVCRALRDDKAFRFEQLMDVCGVDYLGYGDAEWRTEDATKTGFSRGVRRRVPHDRVGSGRRYAVVYHL